MLSLYFYTLFKQKYTILGALLSIRLKTPSILPQTKIMISQKAPIVSFTAIPYFKEGTLGYTLAYLTPQVHFAKFL